MKENSITIKGMEKGLKDIKTGIPTLENFDLAKLMVKGFIDGSITKSTTENGKMDLNTETECGEVPKEIAISENGSNLKLMAMESMHGQMEIDMKVCGSNVLSTEKELIFLLIKTLMLANINMESQTVKVPIHGRMELHMLDSSN